MVRIRLTRTGAKKKPSYRFAVADKRSPRDGRCLEYLGHYNPMVEPPVINLDLARVDYWIKNDFRGFVSLPIVLDPGYNS